jgi:MFS family permease
MTKKTDNYDSLASQKESTNTLIVFLKLMFTGVILAIILGASCNGINVQICSSYFPIVLRWEMRESFFRMAIAQGIFEGLLFGIGFSLVFTITALCMFKKKLSYYLGLRYLLIIIFGAILGWFIGGIIMYGLACLSPTWIETQFMRGNLFEPATRFAWVGGSINGMIWGGFIFLIISIVFMYQKSLQIKQEQKREQE